MISRQSGVGLAETVRDAFDAADRRLEDHVRKSRGYVKSHAPAAAEEGGEDVEERPARRRRLK